MSARVEDPQTRAWLLLEQARGMLRVGASSSAVRYQLDHARLIAKSAKVEDPFEADAFWSLYEEISGKARWLAVREKRKRGR